MKLSRECYYGLLSLRYLARRPAGTILQAQAVARGARLPRLFLARILHKLAKAGILRSYRGAQRGYALARASRAISVREIIEVFDTPRLFLRCIFWSNRCSDSRPCPLHETWKSVRPLVASLMDAINLEDIASAKRLPALAAVIGIRGRSNRHARAKG